MSIKALRKLQLGRETTAGTAVAASTIYRVENALLKDDRVVVFPGEDVGNMGGLNRSYTAFLGGSLSMPDHPATFEQILHIFEAGIKAVGTGVADTGGSGKIYAYPVSTTAANTIKTYTIEGGDDQQAEKVEYCFVKSFTLSGGPREAVMLGAEWEGRQVSLCSFTTGQSAPTVEEILFAKGSLAIDAVSGTIGATVKSNTLMGFNLNVITGFQSVPAAQGTSEYFAFVKQVKPEITLNVTFEHDTTAVAEKAAWRAHTPRQLRLKFIGSALTTAGTYSTKQLIVDLAGKWETFDVIGEQDGNDVVAGTFRAGYDTTAALFAEFMVVNELTSVP